MDITLFDRPSDAFHPFDPDKAFGSLVRRFGFEHDLIILGAKLLQAGAFDYEAYHILYLQLVNSCLEKEEIN